MIAILCKRVGADGYGNDLKKLLTHVTQSHDGAYNGAHTGGSYR